MKDAPETSILIPVYNREHLIGPCIESALSQSVPDLEVVVVDNASTDGTWSVCERYARQDPRVRVFKNDRNIGPVLNWKRCFDEARGRFGKVLFSDDLMAPAFLEKALPLLSNPEVGFVFSSIELGPEPGRPQTVYWWKPSTGTYPSRTFIESSICGISIPVSPGAGLFRMDDLRKHLMLEIPSPTGREFASHGAGPDVLLYLLTARAYPKVGYVADPVSFFRAHGGSITEQESGNDKIWEHHYQAKVWFAETGEADGAPPTGRLLGMCLAHGWTRHVKRYKERLPTEQFAARFAAAPAPIPLSAQWNVYWYRFKARMARKLEAAFGGPPAPDRSLFDRG
ncbi:MAG: glycosyltransferase family 2 protein [Leptospirillia bacterium]